MNFPTQDFSIPDLGLKSPGLRSLGLKSSWLKSLGLESLGLESSLLKSLGLKGLGLKLGVEKSGVEMSFNHKLICNSHEIINKHPCMYSVPSSKASDITLAYIHARTTQKKHAAYTYIHTQHTHGRTLASQGACLLSFYPHSSSSSSLAL